MFFTKFHYEWYSLMCLMSYWLSLKLILSLICLQHFPIIFLPHLSRYQWSWCWLYPLLSLVDAWSRDLREWFDWSGGCMLGGRIWWRMDITFGSLQIILDLTSTDQTYRLIIKCLFSQMINGSFIWSHLYRNCNVKI